MVYSHETALAEIIGVAIDELNYISKVQRQTQIAKLLNSTSSDVLHALTYLVMPDDELRAVDIALCD